MSWFLGISLSGHFARLCSFGGFVDWIWGRSKSFFSSGSCQRCPPSTVLFHFLLFQAFICVFGIGRLLKPQFDTLTSFVALDSVLNAAFEHRLGHISSSKIMTEAISESDCTLLAIRRLSIFNCQVVLIEAFCGAICLLATRNRLHGYQGCRWKTESLWEQLMVGCLQCLREVHCIPHVGTRRLQIVFLIGGVSGHGLWS